MNKSSCCLSSDAEALRQSVCWQDAEVFTWCHCLHFFCCETTHLYSSLRKHNNLEIDNQICHKKFIMKMISWKKSKHVACHGGQGDVAAQLFSMFFFLNFCNFLFFHSHFTPTRIYFFSFLSLQRCQKSQEKDSFTPRVSVTIMHRYARMVLEVTPFLRKWKSIMNVHKDSRSAIRLLWGTTKDSTS